MRTHALRLAAVLSVLAFAACDSGDPDGPSPTSVVASVQVGSAAASFLSGAFPTAGTADAPAVDGSEQIVLGGSVLLQVDVPDGADRVLIGVEGSEGYFAAPLPAGNARVAARTVVVTTNPNTSVRTFTVLIAYETDGEPSQRARRVLTVNPDANTSDQLQVSLNWDAPVDLDLHLETPNGEDIYYGNDVGTSGGTLDLDSNAGCSLDRVDNENITWDADDAPASGPYTVRVDLWSACEVDQPIPFVVTVNNRGTVSTFTGTFSPNEADRGGAFGGRVITSFSYGTTS